MALFTLVSRFKFEEFGAGIIYANIHNSHSILKRYIIRIYQMGIRKYSLGNS